MKNFKKIYILKKIRLLRFLMVIDFRQNQRQGYEDLPGAPDFAHVLGTAHLKLFIRNLLWRRRRGRNHKAADFRAASPLRQFVALFSFAQSFFNFLIIFLRYSLDFNTHKKQCKIFELSAKFISKTGFSAKIAIFPKMKIYYRF